MKKLIIRLLMVIVLLAAFVGVYLVGTGDIAIPFLNKKDKAEQVEEPAEETEEEGHGESAEESHGEESEELSEEEEKVAEEAVKEHEEKSEEGHGEESESEEEDPAAELQQEGINAFNEVWGGENQLSISATVTPTASSPIPYQVYVDMKNGNMKITGNGVESIFIQNHLYDITNGQATRNRSGNISSLYLDSKMLAHLVGINDTEGMEVTEEGEKVTYQKKLEDGTTCTWIVQNGVFTTFQEQSSSFTMVWNIALATEVQTIALP